MPATMLGPFETAAAEPSPQMPSRNPWLAEGVYPTSHFNPGATDSVLIAGPVHGRKLDSNEVKTVPTVITSNPAIKQLEGETIAFASGAVGVQKLRLTGKAMEAGNFVAYPGFEKEAEMASAATIQAVLDKLNAAERAQDEHKIVDALGAMGAMGLNLAITASTAAPRCLSALTATTLKGRCISLRQRTWWKIYPPM
jgi:hypothetical protein